MRVSGTASSILVVLATVLLGATRLTYAGDSTTSNVKREGVTFSRFMSATKDFVSIGFYIVVGVLGVLSYRQARKTLFIPMKTEAFKLQLKVLEEILLFFEDVRQKRIDVVFDLERIFYTNGALLLGDYGQHFFKGKIRTDDDKRKAMLADFRYAMVKPHALEHADDLVEPEEPVPAVEDKNPAIVLARWKEYECSSIHYSDLHHEAMQRLDHFVGSPLVPTELKTLVSQFREGVARSLSAIGEVLTEASQEMPEKYPDADSVVKARIDWLWNRYIRHRPSLGNLPGAIQKHVSERLNIDGLLG